MPKRIISYSRTEPARTIIAATSFFVMLAQVWILSPWYVSEAQRLGVVPPDPSMWQQLPPTMLIIFLCLFALRGCLKNNEKHMAIASWLLSMLFLLGALTRILFLGAASVAWLSPFLMFVVMAICYLYMSFQYRRGR